MYDLKTCPQKYLMPQIMAKFLLFCTLAMILRLGVNPIHLETLLRFASLLLKSGSWHCFTQQSCLV